VLAASAAIISSRHTKMRETVLPSMLKQSQSKIGETQEEVTTCRLQQDVSEWLVDESMLLLWS